MIKTQVPLSKGPLGNNQNIKNNPFDINHPLLVLP